MARLRLLFFLTSALCLSDSSAKRTCKLLPTDHAWPSSAVWSSFNSTVGGRVVKTIPIGSPCHNPNFDAAACQAVQQNWTNANFYLPDSSAIMDSVFLNKSCDPFTGPDGQCIIGAYPEYAVNVSSPADIIHTLEFVRNHNIRLVVKNTGHDYMGRSTGHGAVSIWTHYLQHQDWFTDYKDPWSDYRGPAVRAHAGVMGEQLYAEADKRGFLIVAGECPTVGFAGGYIQGGGHSILASYKGMGADQALSFEVITTDGKFINASATENSDLFWALRGGGGGTYGIVWSVTVKAYPDVHISVATLQFDVDHNSIDLYWQAHEIFHRNSPNYSDAGAWVFSTYTNTSFNMPAFILPNHTVQQLTALTAPLFKALNKIGLVYNHSLNEYPGYRPTILALPDFQNPPINNVQYGGRLLPRTLWNQESTYQQFVATVKSIANQGVILFDNSLSPTLQIAGNPDNAVFPQWRTMEKFFLTLALYQPTDSQAKLMIDQQKLASLDDQLLQLAPGAGTYLNEANPFNPNWKKDFYGSNYPRLLSVKNKYDPDQLLYGSISVGGDRWTVTSEGRLCPV